MDIAPHAWDIILLLRKLLAPNIPNDKALGGNTGSCNFSALVMGQGAAPLLLPLRFNVLRSHVQVHPRWVASHGSTILPGPLRCRRFAYGYALDGSEFPCYLVWPQRDGRSYVLLDTATTDTLAHWAYSTSVTPLLWNHKFACVGMLWYSSACMMMSSCLICTLPEQGCCVQDLLLTRNIWLIFFFAPCC